EIPLNGPDRDVVDEELTLATQQLRITAVSVGNPHCVIVVDDLESIDLPRLGAELEHHALFPNRTNVQFVRVDSTNRVAIRIWEGGGGEPRAAGSSSGAVAAACVRLGLTGGDVAVHSPGGVLRVHVAADYDIRLTGPAEETCRGRLSADLVRRLRRS